MRGREMKIIECPNCYFRVALSDAGLCPACHRAPTAETADPTRTKITIVEGQLLPRLCFGCARHTDSLVAVRRSSSSAVARYCRIALSILALPVVLCIPGLRGLFLESLFAEGSYRVIRLKIPVCASCRSQHLPKEGWIDFPEGRMSFIVPKEVGRNLGGGA